MYTTAIIVLSAWGLTVITHDPAMDSWWWYKQLVYVSGLGSFVLMSLIMLLAVRPLWLEKRLHGLDKMYRLHKWAGIWATVLGITHYLLKLSKSTLRELLEHGFRELRIDTFFDGYRGAAKELGEWSIWILGIMLIITLWQRFPYHVWRYTHKAISVIYLFIVFHSVVLTPTGWWAGPAGLLIVISSLIGTCCAFVALSGGIGRSRRYHGTVLRVEQHSGDVLEVTCQLPRYWAHRPGQFAFITFDRFEGAHPFTINSAHQADGQVSFAIKALGDYTTRLQTELDVGRKVVTEGPYGYFDMELDSADPQIWIGAGIGITPFIAWLEALQGQAERAPKAILYYCVNNAEEAVFSEQLLHLTAVVPSVSLRLHYSDQQGFLSVEQALKGHSNNTKMWFCGPQGFADGLQKGMQAHGCPPQNFHKEYFNMR